MNHSNDRMQIVASLHPWRKTIELRAVIESRAGTFFAQPLVIKLQDEGQIVDPFVTLEAEAAQELMDELWRCGLRPSEGAGSAGQAAAMQRHLDDMRKLAFHALKVKS